MCYRFELLEFNDCLFENIDATYILHLEGNGRIEKIHEQLKTYHPSKKVYLVYNKGYKECKKDIHPQETHSDLVHANMTVFEHATHYKHVLVLEDDFIFSKEIIPHAKQVDSHFVYQLGSLPLLSIPIDIFLIHLYQEKNFWTNLENDPIVGFSILYFLAKLIPFLILFIVLWILCLTSLKGKRVRR